MKNNNFSYREPSYDRQLPEIEMEEYEVVRTYRGVTYKTRYKLAKTNQDNIEDIKYRGSSIKGEKLDLIEWFLSNYSKYKQGEKVLPQPPFKISQGIQVVNNNFYDSLKRAIEQKNTSTATLETLADLYKLAHQ